jgi:hypothetical protein
MSIAVTSISTQMNTIGAPKCEINSLPKNIFPFSQQDNVILWSNNPWYWSVGYHSQDDPPEDPRQWDSFVADDFIFENETEVKWLFWQIYYAHGPGGKDYHYDWNVTFFEDDGTGNNPGDIYVGPITIADEDIGKSFPYFATTTHWACGAFAYLPEPVSFNADTKYWMTIYSIGSIYPQTYLPCHNETAGGILLHEAKFKSDHWGFPDWTNLSDPLLYGQPLDVNFVLGGDPFAEVKIKKGLGVTITFTNNLPAGDEYIAHNMTVNCTATGNIFFNPTKNVLYDEIPGQTTKKIRWFPIGFGKITINVTCTSLDAGLVPVEEEALLLLFLTI